MAWCFWRGWLWNSLTPGTAAGKPARGASGRWVSPGRGSEESVRQCAPTETHRHVILLVQQRSLKSSCVNTRDLAKLILLDYAAMGRLFLIALEPWPESHSESAQYRCAGNYRTTVILLNNLIGYFTIVLMNYGEILTCRRTRKLLSCKCKYLILKYAMFVYTFLQLYTMWSVQCNGCQLSFIDILDQNRKLHFFLHSVQKTESGDHSFR